MAEANLQDTFARASLVVSGDPARHLISMPLSYRARLSQKITLLTPVGWGLAPHLTIGGRKARRYAELANGEFI